ncbi:YceI family protein [Candidatus Peregrinibacteria bacterium]|nr:MAG: YceI family protein [Candidatus Peregrinibacteria bacterium]
MKKLITFFGLSMIVLSACSKPVTMDDEQKMMENESSTEMMEESEMSMEKDMSGTIVDGTYQLVPAESAMNWKGKKVTGEHYGRVQVQSGSVDRVGGVWSNAQFTIDMSSIVSDDLEGENATSLENHLKSEDFFNVAEYPTAELVASTIEDQGDGTVKAMADLTIKGITKPVEVVLMITPVDSTKLVASGNLVLDRTLWDVRYGSGKFFSDLGDKLVDDEMSFELNLTFMTDQNAMMQMEKEGEMTQE